MPGRGPAAAAEQDATGGYRFQALAKEPGVRPIQERNGMGGAHEEGKAQGFWRVLHKECYNGILQLRSSLCNTVQNVRQSGL